MVKTKTWIAIIAVLAVVCAGLGVWLFTGKPGGTIANVYRDGECIYSVDLSRVTQPYEITLEESGQENVICVEKGRIRIIDANCPDHTCVNMGWLSGGKLSIVCLPHKLVIRLEGHGAEDLDIDTAAR